MEEGVFAFVVLTTGAGNPTLISQFSRAQACPGGGCCLKQISAISLLLGLSWSTKLSRREEGGGRGSEGGGGAEEGEGR